MVEIWKYVVGYEKYYQVSNLGKIKTLRKRKLILKPCINKKGYYNVCILNKVFLIHRLVAKAFIDNPENKPTVNHIDGNKLNNCVENLEWATWSEQNIHAFKLGLQNNKGSNHPQHKLIESDVLEIRNLLKTNIKINDIAKLYNVSRSTIESIKYNYHWRHIL